MAEAGQGFEIDFDSLDRFQKCMEMILKDLVEDSGSLAQITRLDVGASDLGEEFAEAPWIRGMLLERSTRLQQLVATLLDQIAAMKLSVMMAAGNTEAVDEETRRALSETLKRIEAGTAPAPAAPGGTQAAPGQAAGLQ
ncbi:hypothetical protein GT354_39615 [Streptomyces sp. SID3343]|nr:hypothetical protein [Streptomyces sp. SID3343]